MAEKLDMGGTPPIPFSHITNSTEASRGAESSASELEQPAEMPPGGSRRPRTPRREVDLSSVLTAGEKNELSLLVSKITDRMQQQITRVFDATGVGDPQKNSPPSFWSKLPANLRDLSLSHREKENVNLVNTEPKEGPADADAAAPGTKKEKEALGLEELKKETLQYFRRWQTAVQRRVADISVKNTSASSRGQTFAAVSKKGNGSREASKPLETATTVVEADAALIQLYPPSPTSLCSLPLEKRNLILHSMLLLLLSLEHYSAYSRVLLLHMASSLHIPLHVLAEDEVRVAKSLSESVKNISGDEVARKQNEENKSSRKWKVGLATVAGAAVVGITGGLAAPLVAAGIGTVLGGIGMGGTAAAGLLGAMAESSVVVGTLFGVYGARASAKMVDQYARDIQDFAFLPLHGALRQEYRDGRDVDPEDRRLRVVLGISGWLFQKEDVVNPWRCLGHQSEVYALRWELEALLKMGNSLETVVKSAAWSLAKKEIIARTIFASLFEALWPISLLKISKIIDNPWSVGMVRADKAGAVLADAIINKVQAERGITLIGYSLGARVIYTCLMSLAEKRAFGLVENVVMMGSPAPSDVRVWCALRSVVAGRLVNVYSENDYILGFLYRTSSIQYGVAGLQRVETERVENVDVSDKVSGHLRYQFLVGSILKHIGWEDVDLEQVAQDEETLMLLEEKNRERERKRDAVELDVEAAEIEKEVSEKNDEKNLEAQMHKPAKN